MTDDKLFSDIMESIYALIRVLQGYNKSPRKYGTEDLLYLTEAHTIKMIGDIPGLSLNELADKMYRTKSAASMTINKLKDKGLIDITRDVIDSRRYVLTLTKKGQTVYDFHQTLDSMSYNKALEEVRKLVNVDNNDLKSTDKTLKSLLEVLNKTPD